MRRFDHQAVGAWLMYPIIGFALVSYALDPRYQHWDSVSVYIWPVGVAIWVAVCQIQRKQIKEMRGDGSDVYRHVIDALTKFATEQRKQDGGKE